MSISAPTVDFHSHLLPAADHGSSGLEETKRQLAIYRNAGVSTVVATPHFYPNSVSVKQFLSTVSSAAAELSEHLATESLPSPRILLGAEVLYCDNLHRIDHLEDLCIRGTDLLLLELPMSPWSEGLFHTVHELNKRCRVVLAHIDRYVRPHADELWELLADGAMAQVNAYALSSFFERRRLLPFFAEDKVVALGSDLHKTDAAAVAKLVGVRKYLGEGYDEVMEKTAELLSTAKTI